MWRLLVVPLMPEMGWRIPRPCPTVNDWHGGPRWKYHRLRDAWMREFPPTTALTRATEKRSVFIVRVYPKKRGQKAFDDDNLRGGAKPILDALRRLGWIKNDSPRWCSLFVEQRHPIEGERQEPHTIVVLLKSPTAMSGRRSGSRDTGRGAGSRRGSG